MCSLIVARGLEGGPGLFVIANRDEFLDRPAEGPRLHRRGAMKIVAPRDLRARGTWLGLNEKAVFAGITNRFRSPSRPEHRSRGELVFRALEEGTAREGAVAIASLDPDDYNGFHLLVADLNEAFVVVNHGEALRTVELSDGFSVITERSFGAAPSARLERLQERLSGLAGWTGATEQTLRRWMAESDETEPLEGTCICNEEMNYGTRSSTIISLEEPWRFLHAQGPPCRESYQEVQLSRLFAQ